MNIAVTITNDGRTVLVVLIVGIFVLDLTLKSQLIIYFRYRLRANENTIKYTKVLFFARVYTFVVIIIPTRVTNRYRVYLCSKTLEDI